jgi:hypothetical protein
VTQYGISRLNSGIQSRLADNASLSCRVLFIARHQKDFATTRDVSEYFTLKMRFGGSI